MDRIPGLERREVWSANLARPYEFASPFGTRDFVVLLAVLDESITTEDRSRVSDQLVRQGCRYAVCWGHACTLWDDSIDWSFLELHDYEVPDERFVMTTWHENDSIEEVAEFFVFNTSVDEARAVRYALVCLGADAATYRRFQQALVAHFHERRRLFGE